ncbi:cyclic nucleotide-binding domain-containing protein [Gilvimarinus agarilyticus]|uniref:cyclic nucleotide-binding domain-containing protein n=1 Tax=unclassified Gilvimarinus TaxID=2642066 RepID=UPI001C0846B8|nr:MULTISPECIES: cyclic nucleotide-binding domain-containing protein [unclassified Gilvimarinus]MBU2885379.1 cyclic nucleotide-binding domain-containing protein [Gilvimarinus agarilyticus]MDO6570278.1 cyclic nucleotide-binding domain-containing protein [Gilvimarinus sp. 2_MG-2023]MDO6746934.1 cyclic nucleotide-binding domain-containing protein [Gilvimarinus sp. 1_MG-2023]
MEIKRIETMGRQTIEQLLSAIPFFKAVKQADLSQFEVLLQFSRIITYAPGEVVLQRGDGDQCLYFLLKGRLAVYPGESLTADPVNFITPGEVFGDLARLTHRPRSATIVADSPGRESMVFSSDFSELDNLRSTYPISLQTKLLYYRNTVHNLRWKLEVYRSQHPKDDLANQHRAIRLYMGPKDTPEELQSLYQQACELANLLVAWNDQFGGLSGAQEASGATQLISAVDH